MHSSSASSDPRSSPVDLSSHSVSKHVRYPKLRCHVQEFAAQEGSRVLQERAAENARGFGTYYPYLPDAASSESTHVTNLLTMHGLDSYMIAILQCSEVSGKAQSRMPGSAQQRQSRALYGGAEWELESLETSTNYRNFL